MRAWHKQRRIGTGGMLLLGIVLVFAPLPAARAHEGPPFPILMDQPAAGYVVSVWADPDIGEATFFIIVETAEGKTPRQPPNVSMWAEPISGRLERVTYEANRQSLRNQMQFKATPYFDRRDMWNVGFRIEASGGAFQELTTEIESTPPGFGVSNLVIYAIPFVALGGLWLMAMSRRRRIREARRALTPPGSDPLRHESEGLIRSKSDHEA